ncbi:hypothetical protein [Streptomyces scopuliridis]|uniref:hypothetical protein n=1 Tax=Streptomyces scopuliridis TaxID=452529 RepID=UPI00342EBF0F
MTNTSTVPAGDLEENDILCDVAARPYALVAAVVGDDDAGVWVSAYTLDDEDPRWFPVTFEPGEMTLIQRETLAYTGRSSRLPIRAAVVTASIATVAALSVVLSTEADAPSLRMTPMPFVSSAGPVEPYLPEPREPSLTSRQGARAGLTSREEIAKPSVTPATRNAIATPPADIRISFYKDCTGHAQNCIDDGHLTMYGGRILAGHNYMGYQWLSRVPVGRTVRVISGPLAGTYRVYGHMRLSRQGGAIPSFGGAELVLQSCEGSGTGFSLLKRV